MITVADVKTVIARPKTLVAPMAWAKKLNHTDPVWCVCRSALQYEDDPTETPEGLYIIGQWKRRDGVKPEVWEFGMHHGQDRIYAIDIQPLAFHTNRVGEGRPFFHRRIRGMHEHTWSDEGYGYVEALGLDPADGASAWNQFVMCAGIVDTSFIHPDRAINDGQQELGL